MSYIFTITYNYKAGVSALVEVFRMGNVASMQGCFNPGSSQLDHLIFRLTVSI